MNYVISPLYQDMIVKATGVASEADVTDIVITMGCRFGELTERQIKSKAKRAWAEVQEVRAMFPQPKNVTGTATKALAC